MIFKGKMLVSISSNSELVFSILKITFLRIADKTIKNILKYDSRLFFSRFQLFLPEAYLSRVRRVILSFLRSPNGKCMYVGYGLGLRISFSFLYTMIDIVRKKTFSPIMLTINDVWRNSRNEILNLKSNVCVI